MNEILNSLYPFDPEKPLSLEAAYAYCKKLAVSHYENFTVGSYLLPKDKRPHVYALYAFCRWADDLGDEIGDPKRSFELLDFWAKELMACYNGIPRHPVFIALKKTIQTLDLPLKPFQDLIKAFKIDQVVTRYKNLKELDYYCRHSANPVGRIFLMLFGYRDEERFALSDATCTALQITNFLQDITVDLKKGRIYIPLEDMSHFHYSEEDFQQNKFNDSFRELMKFEIHRVRELFQEGLKLVEKVKGRVQLDIELFNRGGMAILDAIEKINYNVFSKRPILSKFSKSKLALQATFHLLQRRLC